MCLSRNFSPNKTVSKYKIYMLCSSSHTRPPSAIAFNERAGRTRTVPKHGNKIALCTCRIAPQIRTLPIKLYKYGPVFNFSRITSVFLFLFLSASGLFVLLLISYLLSVILRSSGCLTPSHMYCKCLCFLALAVYLLPLLSVSGCLYHLPLLSVSGCLYRLPLLSVSVCLSYLLPILSVSGYLYLFPILSVSGF